MRKKNQQIFNPRVTVNEDNHNTSIDGLVCRVFIFLMLQSILWAARPCVDTIRRPLQSHLILEGMSCGWLLSEGTDKDSEGKANGRNGVQRSKKGKT